MMESRYRGGVLRSNVTAAVGAVVGLAALLASPAPARAERGEDTRRLAAAMGSLAPYDLDGQTLAALDELASLAESLDSTVASTARFLRAAAAVELLAYARLTDDDELAAQLARAMRVPAADLVWAVERDLGTCARRGSLARQAASARAVLECLAPTADAAACAPRLRQVADSDRAGASAARLLLLDRVVRAAEAARRQPPGQAVDALVGAAGPLCAATTDAALRAACGAAAGPDAEARTAVAQATLEAAAADVAALRCAAAGGDPLAGLAESWLEGARSRMGWLVLSRPLDPAALPEIRLPEATAEPTAPPMTLLVVGRDAVTVGMSPATILGPEGAVRLDERTGLGLPGRRVLSLPGSFRAVIRPVPEVTAALTEARTAVGEALDAQGEGGPEWLASERDVLGLLVDSGTTLVDLARYVASAREAGFQRFALFGVRQDGRLAAVRADVGSVQDGPPAAVPRVTVGPTEVTLSGPTGPAPRFQRRGELARLGQAAVAQLVSEPRTFAVEGRPMMPFGIVFPSMDAVVAAAQPEPSRCLLLLPQ